MMNVESVDKICVIWICDCTRDRAAYVSLEGNQATVVLFRGKMEVPEMGVSGTESLRFCTFFDVWLCGVVRCRILEPP